MKNIRLWTRAQLSKKQETTQLSLFVGDPPSRYLLDQELSTGPASFRTKRDVPTFSRTVRISPYIAKRACWFLKEEEQWHRAVKAVCADYSYQPQADI